MANVGKRKGNSILHFFNKTMKKEDKKDENNNTEFIPQPSTSTEDNQVDLVVNQGDNVNETETGSHSQTGTQPNVLDGDPAVTSGSSETKSSSTNVTRVRHFQTRWLNDFTWLKFDKGSMYCNVCVKHNKSNSMTTGDNTNFRTSTLSRHADCSDHKAAILADSMAPQFDKAVKNLQTSKEKSVLDAMHVVFWLAKEDIAISKYDSLINLLLQLDCPNISGLKTAKSVTYTSDKAACDMLESIAAVIRENIDKKLDKSPYISILCDESTDIGVKKKLVIYVRILDIDTFQPSTIFLCNLEVESATGRAIYGELADVMDSKKIPLTKVMGLGTDGAAVMTGKGEGVTGYMLRENPMMLNYHCLAHKLALVTSQAANEVPYLVDYQSTLTGIFYFFKASASRTTKLASIQDMLDEPKLKIKEVHEVRWLSVYIAVRTVYQCLDSLISYFCTDKDARSKGYSNKMSQYDFIASTYLLMDVLPVVSKLCLLFQKADLDVSLVQVSVEHCKSDLIKIKDGVEEHTYLHQLQTDHLKVISGKLTFKENHIVKGKQNLDSIKVKFIDAILDKLDQRFPTDESNIIYAFSVLAMRPISFCSRAELETWGDDKLQILIEHYGKPKQSKPRNNYDQPVEIDPIIDAEATKTEWSLVKSLVINAGYPRDRMSDLWGLINKHHREDLPNLLKLAALALIAPIHTSDCERGFSAQNQAKTPARNRLSSARLDDILMVKLEGGPVDQFDYSAALIKWKNTKDRKIFCVSKSQV